MQPPDNSGSLSCRWVGKDLRRSTVTIRFALLIFEDTFLINTQKHQDHYDHFLDYFDPGSQSQMLSGFMGYLKDKLKKN